MKLFVRFALAALVALSLSALSFAADPVTMDGKVVCAKCTLKKADAKECQNVFVSAGKDGQDVEYYIVNAEAGARLGEVCTKVMKVRVTGTVAEKDGRKWITASSIEDVKG